MSQLKPVIVLDGGTGTSLIEMGHTNINGDPLWSASLLATYPDTLKKLHKDFYVAGSDIVLSASYQASIEGFQKRFQSSESEAENFIKKSVELVKQARDEARTITGRSGFVAASVGPYGATLCDYSEYHGRYADAMSRQELEAWHLPRLKLLVDATPDLLAIETIPVLHEAEAILSNMKHFPGTKVWVSFQCKDSDHTAHGEDIRDAVRSVSQWDCVAAVGVNCVHPEYIVQLLNNIGHIGLNIPILVKPNGQPLDLITRRQTEKYKICDLALEWVKAGASWIGGCCKIGPSDIEEIRKTLAKEADISLLKSDGQLF